MASGQDLWRNLGTVFERVRRHVSAVSGQLVSARGVRDEVRAAADEYFSIVRPNIADLLGETIAELDLPFQELLRLSERTNRKSSFEKQLKRIHKLYPRITAKLAISASAPAAVVSQELINAEDQRIAKTLEGLVPSAARSFKQALTDLSDGKRFSYRGPAVELREALRETLDYLAPDEEVMAAPGYKHEADRKAPTMKQKVRFILKARGQKDETAPEQAANAVDAIVGSFARSVYEMSNAGTHGTRERAEVMRIRRYVVVVLHDILALPPE